LVSGSLGQNGRNPARGPGLAAESDGNRKSGNFAEHPRSQVGGLDD
jgi:hypothetical protein